MLHKVVAFGGEVGKLIIEPPASEAEVSEIEDSLGFNLPFHFREVILKFSKHLELRWHLPENANLPQEFKEISSGEIREQNLEVLKGYDKSLVLRKVLEKVEGVDDCQKEIFYKIIGNALGDSAVDWVRSLWANPINVSPIYRSYLTAKCLPMEEGLSKVITYVEGQFTDEVNDHIAKEHLCHFRSYKVVDWIKGYIPRGTAKHNWYSLYASSEPTWDQIKEWLELGDKYRMVTINALEYMIQSWMSTYSYIKGQYRITNPPNKEEIISTLEKMRNQEILNTKKRIYTMIIEEIDCIL